MPSTTLRFDCMAGRNCVNSRGQVSQSVDQKCTRTTLPARSWTVTRFPSAVMAVVAMKKWVGSKR